MQTDINRPNVSRIYDYVLGGHHNLEVDRKAAQQILQVFPSYPRWARLNRWFLQMVALQWGTSEHHCILDLGSGLPTQGHFHTSATNARVLYTDSDPVTVAYAKEVLKDDPKTMYIQIDIRNTSALLEVAQQHFRGERRVAIGCIGIAYFLDDPTLRQLLHTLYDWAAPGSVMAMSFAYSDMSTANMRETGEHFKRVGAELFFRDEEMIRQVVTPWHIRELKPLTTWLGMEHLIQEADHENTNAEMFGVMVEHRG